MKDGWLCTAFEDGQAWASSSAHAMREKLVFSIAGLLVIALHHVMSLPVEA